VASLPRLSEETIVTRQPCRPANQGSRQWLHRHSHLEYLFRHHTRAGASAHTGPPKQAPRSTWSCGSPSTEEEPRACGIPRRRWRARRGGDPKGSVTREHGSQLHRTLTREQGRRQESGEQRTRGSVVEPSLPLGAMRMRRRRGVHGRVGSLSTERSSIE